MWGVLYGEQARFFNDEIKPHLKHKEKGFVGMASKFACENFRHIHLLAVGA